MDRPHYVWAGGSAKQSTSTVVTAITETKGTAQAADETSGGKEATGETSCEAADGNSACRPSSDRTCTGGRESAVKWWACGVTYPNTGCGRNGL